MTAPYPILPFITPQMYGALANGIHDDYTAIVAANSYLNSVGGGTLYFPAGHYKSNNGANSIIVYNNVQYVGEGYGSWLDFQGNCFSSPLVSGASFGLPAITGLTTYPANNISAPTNTVTTTTATNAGNFAAGDIVLIRSTTALVTGGNTLPYYMEINRVVGTPNPTTGVITLEDEIQDGWSGVVIAKITAYASQGYRIANLRATVPYTTGNQPIVINCSYKALIEDIWTTGISWLSVNAFVRSIYKPAFAEAFYSSAVFAAELLEFKCGSSLSRLDGGEFSATSADGTSPGSPPNLFSIGEASRHFILRGPRISAPALSVGDGITTFDAEGTIVDGCYLTASSFTNVLNLSYSDQFLANGGALINLPQLIKGISFKAPSGFGAGIDIASSGTIQNITVTDFDNLSGTASSGAIVFQSGVTNGTFDQINCNGSITDGGVSQPFTNVLVSNSQVTGYNLQNLVTFSDVTIRSGQTPSINNSLTLGIGTKTATATGGAATLNKSAGVITSESITTAAGSDYTLTLTNSVIATADQVFASAALGGATTGEPCVTSVTPGSGSVVIKVRNIAASAAFNGTIVVSFFVLKN